MCPNPLWDRKQSTLSARPAFQQCSMGNRTMMSRPRNFFDHPFHVPPTSTVREGGGVRAGSCVCGPAGCAAVAALLGSGCGCSACCALLCGVPRLVPPLVQTVLCGRCCCPLRRRACGLCALRAVWALRAVRAVAPPCALHGRACCTMRQETRGCHARGDRARVRCGQTHPHRPRLVVSFSTWAPFSLIPTPAHSFFTGPPVTNIHTASIGFCRG